MLQKFHLVVWIQLAAEQVINILDKHVLHVLIDISIGFFAGLIERHPVYQPATTPIYSNAAYQILSYALEAMTNKTFESMLDDKIFTPLKMNSSSLSTPKSASSGVIPVNELMSGWNVSAGEEGP